MKVLIVDDSSFKRKSLAYILQSNGHEVLEATDGVEGLEKARAHMPDFIISDLLMPGMDGFQFLREIKRDEQLRAIPVICYSETFKDERERELVISLGASGFISDIDKPDLLMNMIREITTTGKEAQGIRPTIEGDSDFFRAYSPILNAKHDKKIRDLEHEKDMAQTYFEMAGVMFVLIGSDEKVTLINRKGREVLGYPAGEIIGKNWFDNFLPERSREEVRGVFRKIMGEELEAVEYYVNPVLTGRGEERTIAWHNTVLRDDSGKITASLSSGEDITERMKAEEEIKALSRFPDENPNPVMRVGADGTLLYANTSSVPLLEFWGCRPGGLLPDQVREIVSETLKVGQFRELMVKVDDSIYSMFFTPIAGSGYVNIYGRDVTEAKRAEDALRESEEKFVAAFESSPAILALLASDGRIVDANKACSDFYGFSLEEMIGKTSVELGIFDEDERQKVLELVRNGGGALYNQEVEVHIRDGSLRHALASQSTVPIRGVPYQLATLVDITDRKTAEERLRLSEERFSKAFFTSPACLTITRIADGKFIDVNDTFLRTFEFSRDEVIGHASVGLNILSQEERNKAIKKQLESGGVREIELQGRSKTGRVITLLLSSCQMVLEGEDCHITTMIDISDRKKAEEELKIRNEELLAINRIITTSVSTFDTKEMLDKILVEALDIVGLEGGVVCMLEPDDTLRLVTQRGSSEATIADLTTNRIKVGDCLCGNCARDQCPLILPDRKAVMEYATREALRGEAINFHAAFPFVSKGRSIGVLCVFTRTDRKPNERSLKLLKTLTVQAALAMENAIYFDKIQQNAAELERKVEERTRLLSSANKELESFFYSVSHDLRAPLRAIRGFAEIIAERHRAGLNDEGRHYVDNIVLAGERMSRLIDDLLNYARLGRTVINREPVPLSSIFDRLSSEMSARFTETGGTLNIADDLPSVMGDRSLLSRIFTNLVENAVIYRRTDIPPRVVVTYERDNGRVILKVSDNGIGIPSEHLEKIFNLFQRLHGDDEHPGTGVGLAIVKKSVEMLGGSVKVESEVGKGSTFLVELERSD